MQGLGRSSTLQTAYTDDQVRSILLDQQNQERWFFDQLDAGLNFKNDLSPFIDFDKNNPKVTYDSTSAVQRSLTLSLRGDAPLKQINSLSDIIGVRYQLLAPDGGWLEWSLGKFTLTPFDKDKLPGWTWQTLKAPDFNQFLVDATLTSAFTALVGSSYISNVNAIISSYGGQTPLLTSFSPSSALLPASLTWDIGTTRLQVVNDLLAAINYFPLWWDENGVGRSSPIPDYNSVVPSFIFDTTVSSIVMVPIQERPDITKIFNIVVVIVEDSRRAAFAVTYQNINASDPISMINWHPKTLIIRDSKITDKVTAFQRGRTEAQYASQVYGKQTITTFPWSLSQNRDVYQLIYNATDEGLQSDLYVEMGWDHTCKTGKATTHTLQKIVVGS